MGSKFTSLKKDLMWVTTGFYFESNFMCNYMFLVVNSANLRGMQMVTPVLLSQKI